MKLKNNLKPLFATSKTTWEVPDWAGSGEYGCTMLRQELAW